MIPKVIHPVKVLLHHRLETLSDDFGVTGEIIWAEPIELKGQVKYNKFEQLIAMSSGNDPISEGHIVFYSDEWQKSNGVIGDELELEDSSRLIVIEICPSAHYHGKFYHVHVYFSRKRIQ